MQKNVLRPLTCVEGCFAAHGVFRSCDSKSVVGMVLSPFDLDSVGAGAVAQLNSGKTRNKQKKLTHHCPVSERACDNIFFFKWHNEVTRLLIWRLVFGWLLAHEASWSHLESKFL